MFGVKYGKRWKGPWVLLYMYYFSMEQNVFLKDAVLEVPVEAVVDMPGEEGGVPELPVALGAGEALRPLLYMYYFSMDTKTNFWRTQF